ncbi:hypothetical protein [Bradyrhizobium sp. URHC0002]
MHRAEMFRLTAKARALEAEHDHRYHNAAVSLQKIAATMGELDDAMLLKWSKSKRRTPMISID